MLELMQALALVLLHKAYLIRILRVLTRILVLRLALSIVALLLQVGSGHKFFLSVDLKLVRL